MSFPSNWSPSCTVSSIIFSDDVQCIYCKKRFVGVSRRSHLKMHIKTVHLKIRSFHCEYCGKAFTQPGTKNRHQSKSCSKRKWSQFQIQSNYRGKMEKCLSIASTVVGSFLDLTAFPTVVFTFELFTWKLKSTLVQSAGKCSLGLTTKSDTPWRALPISKFELY